MALDKVTLEQEFKTALDAESDARVDPAEARKRTAKAFAEAVDRFVKTGTVNPGIAVATAGTATSQTGTTTGTGTIS